MTAVTVTPANVGPSFPNAKIRPRIAASAIVAGQPVYINATGKVAPADANASSPANRFRGIALNSASANGSVGVLEEGEISGFDLSSLAYDAPVYVSDAVGEYADAAGTTTLLVGRVVPLSDNDLTKVLKVTGYSG